MDKDKQDKKRVNLPETELSHGPITREDLQKQVSEHPLQGAHGELHDALELLKDVEKSVTFFGSARFGVHNVHYKQAKRLAYRLSKEGYVIITGGGPGIMEAANQGARDAGGRSIGLNIELPKEQNLNEFTTENLGFKYFFTRKVALSFAAEAYIYFPGGYGTLDELFEVLTLVQTGKIEQVPVILVGSDYWNYVDRLIKHELYQDHKAVDKDDVHLYTITDDEDLVVDMVKKAPLRNG